MAKCLVAATGGSGVYKVITAAAPLASAPEGTILAVTQRPMPKYSMRRALSDIAAPETGEVCLLLNSDGSFVPLDKREVYAAYILAVYQYDGEKWQSIAWRVRKGGKWITPRLYLWSPGNHHTSLTGSWVGGSAGGQYISITASNSGYAGPIYQFTYTAKKVDLTHYSKLIAEVERIAGNGPSGQCMLALVPRRMSLTRRNTLLHLPLGTERNFWKLTFLRLLGSFTSR